ncbi:nitroreductase family protein [Gordonia sp. Z-3]|jgi:nitroreductase|uniref:nitroreductase family protein n=1 Tax=Gordonia sp. Z-3 TaxID=3115408 RepID=UPI002E2E483D|nr:nitroreductase family protein [Gordonia sp. Z-3]MED5799959.1 nitroreductase family protein [Gordonia sp. Z-3]
MELYDIMRTTFAARQFTDDPLPDDILWRILDNARFAPSGGNRQGAHIIVIRDAEIKQRLSELGEPTVRRYVAQRNAGENPWNPVVPTAVAPDIIDETAVPASFVEPIRRAPVVLVVSVDLGRVAAVDQFLDRVGVVSGASVYPLVWNILLGARAEGYGGNLTSMAIAQEPAVRDLLGLPADHAVAAVVPIGKPVKQLTKLRRQAVDEFVTIDQYDGPAFRG